MAFVSGLMGPYTSPIPISSSLGMAISLAIAFSVTWLALKAPGRAWRCIVQGDATHATGGNPRMQRLFSAVLLPFLQSARKRWLMLAGILAALALSGWVGRGAVGGTEDAAFDNKSEFQVVVEDVKRGTLEDTAATLQELGAFLAQQPEVRDLQGYAGTASPITFNGLVRQYYLRADAEQGRPASEPGGQAPSQREESSDRTTPAPGWRPSASGTRRVKVVEVPPGPPVIAPLVAEVYGPDEAGREAWPSNWLRRLVTRLIS